MDAVSFVLKTRSASSALTSLIVPPSALSGSEQCKICILSVGSASSTPTSSIAPPFACRGDGGARCASGAHSFVRRGSLHEGKDSEQEHLISLNQFQLGVVKNACTP